MLTNLLAALALPELRKRVQFVFLMFAVFILGLHIPVPGIDREAMQKLVENQGVLQLFDVFSGGAFRKFTIFALGITPYINASIIMQLLVVAWPSLEAMQKEGESGRKKIAQYTRYLTAVLALFQASGVLLMLNGAGVLQATPIWTKIQIVVTLTAGTTFLMWIGEMITERGIGQGVSLVIFCSIMARMPYELARIAQGFSLEPGAMVGPFDLFRLLLLFLATIVAIIFVTQGTRRIPIQHAKRTVGNRVYQGGSTFLPFKVNTAGVIPIIFAISLLMFPATIASWFAHGPYQAQAQWVMRIFSPGESVFASIVYALLIIVFTYFYAAIQVNIPDLTENLKKYGSFIPGIRPGRPTQEYLDRVMTRITFAGALFLATIGVIQYYTRQLTGVSNFSLIGGTSLLIVVGVALDTMQNLESHLVMRNYEGFIKQMR
jgi:preprotein translocase subunit SecY